MDRDRPEDAELVGRCLPGVAGAELAFRTLYERHAPACLRFLRGLVGAEDGADCLQETFLRVFRALDRFDTQRAFRPWVLGIAHKVALDRRRRSARRPARPLGDLDVPAAIEPVSASAEQREERALFAAAVAELPPHAREVFLLKQGEGLTYKVTAETLGCSVRTAKNRMRTALTLLGLGLKRRGLVKGGRE